MALPKHHLEAQALFDRIAEDYQKRADTAVYNISSMSFRRRRDIVTRHVLATPAGGTVLDYGMGPAVFGRAATSNGSHYIGIDIAEKMVAMARELNLPNSEFHVGDLDLLDQFVNRADTVLLIGLIDYLEDPPGGLRRLARCVKPGGRLIMSFSNRRSVPHFLRDFSKRAWRTLCPPKSNVAKAFEAPVLENSFVPGRDLIPVLHAEGL